MAADAGLNPGWRVASRVVALHDGEPCGDAAVHHRWPAADGGAAPTGLLAIVDGLGHGLEAATAAQAALDTLAADPRLPLTELMAHLEQRLARTRGAAVGLVRLAGGQLAHAGIGNTRALHLHGGAAHRLPSQNGIVGGGQAQRVSVTTRPLAPGDALVLFTDGLQEAVQLPLLLPEWRRDPDLLCQHLMTRWRAGPDDAGVLALFMDEA